MRFRLFNSLTQGMYTSAGLAVLLATATPSAQAQIVNGGFETPVISGTFQNFTPGSSIGAWTVVGNPGTSVTLLTTTYSEPGNGMTAFQSQEGVQSLDITGPGNLGTSAGVQQSIATVNGQAYTLSFFVGKAQSSTGNGNYSDPTILDLSIDGGARTSFTNPNAGNSGFLNWQKFTFDFTATSASTSVAFFNGTASGNENEVGLDNVTIAPRVAATPEPGTVSLLAGLGLSAGVFLRRRRKI